MANRAAANGVGVNATVSTAIAHPPIWGSINDDEINSLEINDGPFIFAAAGTMVEFEQSVGVSFDGVVVEFLQEVELRSSYVPGVEGAGVVAIDFQQSVVKQFVGVSAEFQQMVVDDG